MDTFRAFSPKIKALVDFQKRAGKASLLPPSCVPVTVGDSK